MCVELPCGYSSQTITKTIAYSGIATFACLIAATSLVGLIIESKHDLQNEYSATLATTSVTVDLSSFNESQEDYPVISTENPVYDEPDVHNSSNDLIDYLEMQMSDPIKACFVLWVILNFVAGLIISIILLQGAQERNLFKVRLWFFATITLYLLWIPIYAYWACNSVEPVNVLMSGFMVYMLGGLCLWVVSAFIEELRIESISHRVGYKDFLVPFYKI